MTASTKTKNIQRIDVHPGQLVKQTNNPNKMSSREFDLLVDNVSRVGMVDPIFVRPMHGNLMPDGKQMYRIVGGHHRYEAAVYLGLDEVPCTVVDHDDFDEDEEKFQIVRMNVIRGKLDPQAFFALYNQLSESYTDEILQDAFGFAEEAEFRRLIDQTAKSLPDKTMQKKFKEGAAEIKTIDGLSKLLNEMFTKYGDTLPYGYMVVDYGGQRSIWLQASKKTMDACDLIGEMCIEQKRTMDDVVGTVLQLIAKGELKDVLDKAVSKTTQAEIPDKLPTLATKDNIEKFNQL